MKSLVDNEICSQDEIYILDSNAAGSRVLYPGWRIEQQISAPPPPRRGPGLQYRVDRFIRARAARVLLKSELAGRVVEKLPFGSVSRALRILRQADVIISTGGTYLVDHYSFDVRALELEFASRLGKPTILWTQSMGPFDSSEARAAIRRIQAVTTMAFFRDERSRSAWQKANNDRKSLVVEDVAPDVVFALEPRPRQPQKTSPSRAIVSVRNWNAGGVNRQQFDFEDYRHSMRAAAKALAAAGLAVDALSTCQGIKGYADDSITALNFFEDVDVRVDREFHTPEQLLDELATTDLVVTTRMHLAILALISGVPAIAIAYEFKTLELFEALGLGDYVVAIEDVTPAWMERKIRRVLQDPQRATLAESERARLRARAMAPAAALRNIGASNTDAS